MLTSFKWPLAIYDRSSDSKRVLEVRVEACSLPFREKFRATWQHQPVADKGTNAFGLDRGGVSICLDKNLMGKTN